MDDSEASMKKKRTKTGSQDTFRDGLDPTYSHLNFRRNELLVAKEEDHLIASGSGGMPVTAQADGLDPTYSHLNFRRNELLVAKEEDHLIASGPGGMPVTAQAAAQERESKETIGNRPYRLICLLCLVTFVLIVTVVGLSIRVSQILQHFTEMETKYRSVNETKAQICELLTSRREHTCSKVWITNKDRCYYVSTFVATYYKAIQECSNRDSRLLQIKSSDEANFVSRNVVLRTHAYWIGKCKDRDVGFGILYKVSSWKSDCGACDSYPEKYPCSHDRRFICEKPTSFPEKIQGLCQKPVEST